MPEGNELGDPDPVLVQDRLQRIMSALALVPVPQAAPLSALPGGHPRARSLAGRRRKIM
jgi:hypothetical protein